MCGFTGYFDLHDAAGASRELAEAMAGALEHRGPDSAASFCDGAAAFGFRRLKIIDLDHGEQPMTNEDGSVVLMCNGEIFNYKELRAELQARGHVFRTSCDVEVLVHLYEDHGTGFLDRLNGQFAFVIYDRRRRSLFLARDQFGISPLFYTRIGDQFIFGSEIKAILRHPTVRREVDLTGLDQVLSLPGLISPRTMFKGIESLKPGHFLVVGESGVEVREYWDLVYPLEGELGYGEPEEEIAAALLERLRRSVRYRLQADVDVGFYLSGGLDSSLIAALIAEATPGVARHSFSIGFNDRRMSETRYQKLMSDLVGSTHHEILFDWPELAERMHRMLHHCECPVKETYNTCSMALSRAARDQGITVILTGEGADELFAGYVGYRFDQSRRRGSGGGGLEEVLEAEMRARLWGDPGLFYETDHYALRDLKEALYSEQARESLDEFECVNFELVNRDRLRGRHPIHQRSYLDFKLRMADHLISDHGDRMALANSVEARYPFLDVDVVELAARIAPDLKLKDLEEKYILKKAAAGLVPREIIEREKFGFHAPGSPLLLRQQIDWINDHLSYDRIRRQGYFDPGMVERLKRQYSRDGFELNLPFESDLLTIVLTFGIFLDVFAMPNLN